MFRYGVVDIGTANFIWVCRQPMPDVFSKRMQIRVSRGRRLNTSARVRCSRGPSVNQNVMSIFQSSWVAVS